MPRRVCAEPGCPAMIDSAQGARCPAHTVSGWVRSPSKTPRMRGREWARLRRYVLVRDHGTCWVCGGDANEVDHRLSLANGGNDSLANLAAICTGCHKTKTINERRRPQEA